MKLLLLLLVPACATPNATSENDLAMPVVNGDMAVLPDLLVAGDGPIVCTLGDPDHCGTCTTVCPPGQDDGGSARFCTTATAFGKCDYRCRGEFYEMDNKPANGCEAEDAPIQDSSTTAVMKSLADGALIPSPSPNNTNPINVIAQIYGDTKEHETAPVMRVNGREDWFKLAVTGTGASDRGVGACLGIGNFPTDNMFEVCLSGKNAATFLPAGCKTVAGGAASACIAQTQGTDGTATYYVRVRRLSGATYTENRYALYIDH